MLQNETLLTFTEAANHLPRFHGRKIHASSIWRWARRGVRGVFLETRRLGGRFVTSVEALERFSKGLAEVPLHEGPTPRTPTHKPRSESKRRRAIQQAEDELRAGGF